MTDAIGIYRKTALTEMARFDPGNAAVVREWCRTTAIRPAEDGGDPVPVPWGFATAAEFGSESDDYRSDALPRTGGTPSGLYVPPCPFNGGYVDREEYRGDTPDAAVYDYLHTRWVPLWVGDFVAVDPTGRHYPVEAAMHARVYERVPE